LQLELDKHRFSSLQELSATQVSQLTSMLVPQPPGQAERARAKTTKEIAASEISDNWRTQKQSRAFWQAVPRGGTIGDGLLGVIIEASIGKKKRQKTS
jgi:hypothetical protein